LSCLTPSLLDRTPLSDKTGVPLSDKIDKGYTSKDIPKGCHFKAFKIREFGQQLGTKLKKISFLPIPLKKIYTFVISRSTVRVRQPALCIYSIYRVKALFLRLSYDCSLGQIWAFDRSFWALLGTKYLHLLSLNINLLSLIKLYKTFNSKINYENKTKNTQ
jgi:hypothetical protein